MRPINKLNGGWLFLYQDSRCGKQVYAGGKEVGEGMRRICYDCPADAELSGFGKYLCETCYQHRLKWGGEMNEI